MVEISNPVLDRSQSRRSLFPIMRHLRAFTNPSRGFMLRRTVGCSQVPATGKKTMIRHRVKPGEELC
jgi:hypothetical protein